VKNEAEKKEFLNVVLVIVFILCCVCLWEREKLESSEWKREWLVSLVE
jgi:hypothetical protein